VKVKTLNRIVEARDEVEKELGMKISKELAETVLMMCMRKMRRIKASEDYLPILYRCELPLQISIIEINRKGEENYRMRKEGEKCAKFA